MRRTVRGLAVTAAVVAGTSMVFVLWLVSGGRPAYGAFATALRSAVPSPEAGVELERVRITSQTGRSVDCLLRQPAGPRAPASRAAIVLLGGIGTGRDAARLVDVPFPAVTLACDYPWSDPSRLPLLRLVPRLRAIRGDVLATPDGLALAASFLVGLPEVDSRRLAAVGASLGVPFVAAWAADDPRVSAVALVYGGGDLPALFEANLRRKIGVGWIRRLTAGVCAALLRDLDPGRTVGRIAPRPLLLMGSRDDDRIPPASLRALTRAAREPTTEIWFNGQHITPRDTSLVRGIADSAAAWLGRILAPLPSSGP